VRNETKEKILNTTPAWQRMTVFFNAEGAEKRNTRKSISKKFRIFRPSVLSALKKYF